MSATLCARQNCGHPKGLHKDLGCNHGWESRLAPRCQCVGFLDAEPRSDVGGTTPACAWCVAELKRLAADGFEGRILGEPDEHFPDCPFRDGPPSSVEAIMHHFNPSAETPPAPPTANYVQVVEGSFRPNSFDNAIAHLRRLTSKEVGSWEVVDAELSSLRAAHEEGERELTRLREKAAAYDRINTPEVDDFLSAVRNEALHQRERWTIEHDGDKQSADWFWLVGYLAGKALHDINGKRLHHIITASAALLNWHGQETGHYAVTHAEAFLP